MGLLSALLLMGVDAGGAAGLEPVPVEEQRVGSVAPDVDAGAGPTAKVDQVSADVTELDLESLLGVSTESSTKTEQKGASAPAVVTVVTAEELRARGYRSLAEVLRTVPGFYDIYDLVTHNVGVRGVNGGARASGNVLKLMINGMPVDFRPTTGNFFGEELIPIQAVERIEIIRGPASALYGANAFLGVINVITRTGRQVAGAHVVAELGLVAEKPSYGVGVLVGGGQEAAEFMVGLAAGATDRSGLALPPDSPALETPGSPLADKVSEGDRAQTLSVVASASVGTHESGKVGLLASVQRLGARAEFQDFFPLTHDTTLGFSNQNYRLTYDKSFGPKFGLQLSGSWFDAAPIQATRINVGRPDYVLQRDLGASGWGAAAEGRGAVGEHVTVVLGADFVREDHRLQRYHRLLTENVVGPDGTVLRAAGTLIPGEDAGATRRFENIGGFLQGLLSLGDVGGVVGARVDRHNIYGINPSARVGVVYAPASRPLSLKLLYGSSFKAPSAEQLYSQPMGVRDVQGYDQLKAQQAHTVELAGGYGFSELGEVTINAFVSNVAGRVEFVQRGLFLQAQNIVDEWVVGGEAEGRFKLARPLQAKLALSAARSLSRSPIPGMPEVHNSLFPPYQAHAAVDLVFPWRGLRGSLELSYVGPRAASQSNALIRGESYELPGHVYGAAAFSLPPQAFWGDRLTTLSLRINDLFSTRTAEPGFGGIELPQPGASFWLTATQSL